MLPAWLLTLEHMLSDHCRLQLSPSLLKSRSSVTKVLQKVESYIRMQCCSDGQHRFIHLEAWSMQELVCTQVCISNAKKHKSSTGYICRQQVKLIGQLRKDP